MISAPSTSTISLFLELLSELERECEDPAQQATLTQCFCERIIPLLQTHSLIQPLRNKWLEKRGLLDFDIHQAKEDSFRESVSAFQKIKRALEALSTPLSTKITEKVTFINKILSGKELYCSPPLYIVLFDEIAVLLDYLVEDGHLDLCRKFAQVDFKEVSVQTDPNSTGYWATWGTEETKGVATIYDEKQIEHLPEEIKRSLCHFDPKRHWITTPYIKKCTFAPSFEKTFLTHQEAHSERTQNASVVWWYFESALFLWKLPDSHFDHPVPKLKTKHACANYFRDLQILSTWRELHSEKDPTHKVEQPTIFTQTFFKQGFKTLVTEIKAYLSSDPPFQSHDETITFELILEVGDQIEGRDVALDSNHLWISVSIGNSVPKHYYLKRFNDDSIPLNFTTTLLHDHGEGGDVEIDFNGPSDSVSKFIKRMGLSKEVKTLFFGRSRGCKVLFKGNKVSFSKKNRKDFCLIMRSIEATHQKNGSPSFRLC